MQKITVTLGAVFGHDSKSTDSLSRVGGGRVDVAVNMANDCKDEGRAPAEENHTVGGLEAA